jgi:DNA-binding MarR family transcriptional regulator
MTMVSSSKGESQRRPGRSLPGHQASSRERNGSAIPRTATRPAKKKDAPFHLALSASLAELLDEGGKTDHRFRQLLYDFSTLGASLEVARAYLASQLGISPPQYNIAMIVANHQNTGGISVTDVARRLHVSTAFITLEAGSMEQAGIVEKKPNPKDRRGVFLRLTRRGESLVESIGPERQRVNDHLFGSLTAKDFRRLSETLSSLLDDFAYTVRLIKSARNDRSPGLSVRGELDALRETARKAAFEIG